MYLYVCVCIYACDAGGGFVGRATIELVRAPIAAYIYIYNIGVGITGGLSCK